MFLLFYYDVMHGNMMLGYLQNTSCLFIFQIFFNFYGYSRTVNFILGLATIWILFFNLIPNYGQIFISFSSRSNYRNASSSFSCYSEARTCFDFCNLLRKIKLMERKRALLSFCIIQGSLHSPTLKEPEDGKRQTANFVVLIFLEKYN